MKTTANPPASDEQIRALLDRCKCPVPFHQVRTRFLGYSASPIMSVSLITIVKDLWGGEFTPLARIDEAELWEALVFGLWNGLLVHQDRSSPFRLLRTETVRTRAGLAALALMRHQELDGFVEGFLSRAEIFVPEELIEMPKRARLGLNELRRMRALFEAVMGLHADDPKEATETELETTLRLIREIAENAEHEMHAVVVACTSTKRQMLAGMSTRDPTVH
jgi:hypothetical protein